MAATVVDSSQSRPAWWASNSRPAQIGGGIIGFKRTVSIATTSLDDVDDAVLLFRFPKNTHLRGAMSVVFDSMDIDAGPLLRVDIGVGKADGTIDYVMLNNTSIPVAGGSILLANPAADFWVDSSGKFLIFKVDRAAVTPQAGNVTVIGYIAIGMLVSSG